jgi:hypothetical protein
VRRHGERELPATQCDGSRHAVARRQGRTFCVHCGMRLITPADGTPSTTSGTRRPTGRTGEAQPRVVVCRGLLRTHASEEACDTMSHLVPNHLVNDGDETLVSGQPHVPSFWDEGYQGGRSQSRWHTPGGTGACSASVRQPES